MSSQSLLQLTNPLDSWRSEKAILSAALCETRRWFEALAPCASPMSPAGIEWADALLERLQSVTASLQRFYGQTVNLLHGLDAGIRCSELDAVQQIAAADHQHLLEQVQSVRLLAQGLATEPAGYQRVRDQLDWLFEQFDQQAERESDRLEWLLAGYGCQPSFA